LAQFCQNPDDKKKLELLASNEGKTEYEIQIQAPLKGLIDLIEEFNVKLSLENLIQISNFVMPRLYTIASSNKQSPNSVHLCVSINIDTLPGGKNKVGLVSQHLQREQKRALEGKGFGKAKINIRDTNVPVNNNYLGCFGLSFLGYHDWSWCWYCSIQGLR
jgi:sulfite reductase alpha subunit-like flavoprotein